jgi:hypothetical protein
LVSDEVEFTPAFRKKARLKRFIAQVITDTSVETLERATEESVEGSPVVATDGWVGHMRPWREKCTTSIIRLK